MSTPLYWHPEYKGHREKWIKWRDLYEGDHATLTSNHDYLWPHRVELIPDVDGFNKTVRQGRERRTRYLNLNEIILSIWTSLFFRKKYSLDPATSNMLLQAGDAECDIDGFGTSLWSFIQNKIAFSFFNYGKVYVLADSFPVRAGSKGEEMQKGLRAFLELLEPLSVVDWQRETEDSARLGQFNYLRHEYNLVPQRKWNQQPKLYRYSNVLRIGDSGRYEIEQFRVEIDSMGQIIDPKLRDASATVLSEQVSMESQLVIPTDLDQIPIAHYESDSWIKDVSEESLRGFNLRSTKDQVEFDSGYRQIFLIGDGIQDRKEAIAQYLWPILPRDSQVQTIEPIDVTGMAASIRESVELTFKMGLNQLRQMAGDSKEGQSADAQTQEKENTLSLVESTLGEIEDVTNQALNHFAAVMGKPNFDAELRLNKEVSQQSFDQFTRIFQAFQDIFRKATGDIVDKAAAKKALQKLQLDPDDEKLALEALNSAKSLEPEKEEEEDADPVKEALAG